MTYRDHPLDALLNPDLWFVTEDPPSFFDVVPPHSTAVCNSKSRKHVGFPSYPAPKLRKRGKDVTERLWEHDPWFFQPPFFALGIDDFVKFVPDISRQVPKVNWLPICNEKDLAGNLQRRCLRPGESRLRKRIKLGTDNGTRVMLEKRIVEVLGNASAFRGLSERRTRRSCLRSGDTIATRRESDWRKIPVKHVCFFSRQCQGFKGVSFRAGINEFVRRKKVGIGDVLDIGPIEKVGIVSDLKMCLSPVVNFI